MEPHIAKTLTARQRWLPAVQSAVRVLGIARAFGTSGEETDCLLHDSPHSQPVNQASARAFAGADLLASPLPSMSASIFRAREAGTRAFMMRLPTWQNDRSAHSHIMDADWTR